MSPLLGAALHDGPEGDAGAASGVIQTLMQVGVAFGVAVIGLIFFALLGGATDPASYSTAFIWALIASPVLSLMSLLLVSVLTGRGRSRRRGSPFDGTPLHGVRADRQ